MGLARTQASGHNDLADLALLEAGDDDGRQAHDRAVACAGGAGRALGDARVLVEVPQGAHHLVADVEAGSSRGAVPVLAPAVVALHDVVGVVAVQCQQRIRQAQRHRRVVRPLAWFEVEDASADHVRDRLKGARGLKLVRGAQSVTDGEAHQGTARARKKIYHPHSVPQDALQRVSGLVPQERSGLPTNVARNSLGSVFECGRKPHDFNGPISKFERWVGELRATLLGICWVWAHGMSGSVTHVPSLPVLRGLCGRGSRAGYPSPMESSEIV